jgi:hypothetical protein
MKDRQWFTPIPEPRPTLAPKVMGSLIVAASLGGGLFLRGHRLTAIALWLTASLLALSRNFPASRKLILHTAIWLSAKEGAAPYIYTLF